MANVNYNVRFVQAADGIVATIHRNSTTQPVDATSGAPNRVFMSGGQDVGQNGPPVQTSITAATNATPIVLTVASGTGLASGDQVKVEGVLGNTNANGTFDTTVSGTSVTLLGSAGNAAYTSGGTLTKIQKAPSYHVALANVMAAILNDKSVQG